MFANHSVQACDWIELLEGSLTINIFERISNYLSSKILNETYKQALSMAEYVSDKNPHFLTVGETQQFNREAML